jgi:hypothetical protein
MKEMLGLEGRETTRIVLDESMAFCKFTRTIPKVNRS